MAAQKKRAYKYGFLNNLRKKGHFEIKPSAVE